MTRTWRDILASLTKAAALTSPLSVRVRAGRCPVCGQTLLIKLADDPISVRCLRCQASAIHMSLLQVIQRLYADLSGIDVYEMSSRGPVFEFLNIRTNCLTFSEFFDDVPPGAYYKGIQCQDVQRLTFGDESFDLCTSTEVFEHVPDDYAGFREIRRVLRPGGRFIFSVPLTGEATTVERATIIDGYLCHLREPEYHGDLIRGHGRVLCYRNYGRDILGRLAACGFHNPRFEPVECSGWWNFGTDIIVAGAGRRPDPNRVAG